MKPPLSHFVIALVLSVVALATYGFGYSVISAKSAESADLQNTIDTNTESVARIAAARTALAEIAGDEAQVQNYFISDAGIVPFIDDLEARGKTLKSSVNVTSVGTGSAGGRPLLVLSLVIGGTFDAVMRTAGSIEFAPYDLSITSLSLKNDAKNAWHADMQITVGSVPAAPGATTTPATISVPTSATTTPAKTTSPSSSGKKPIPTS